jgi:Cu/Ag efflux protein CusF
MKRLLLAVMMLSAPVAFAVDASEVGPKLKETAQKVSESAKEKVRELGRKTGLVSAEHQGTFEQGKAFQLRGTIQDVGSGEITVARSRLPPASLEIRDRTKVTIDGKPAKATDLKEGAEVSALFQLEGEEIVAVVVNARGKRASGTGGAGAAGRTSKDAQKEL